ncbi:Ribonuclease H-like protein [Lasiodiplodia theobromae]|uniref:Ribonuclease H-like protein n=1 Tax=Lasiodiplodia theobromae TaxID=45133 RepID=A0A8H7MBJ6_9PEZI|nr:Ribonuclease H-like protein [Lasiodiplodia theobromae]
MLPSTYWQLRYEADDLEEEINKWRPQLAAAAAQKRREERSNIYGWKAIGRRTASEIWSTLSDHMAKLLPTVHYKTELLERKLREHNPILLSRRNFAAKWRERMNEYEELGVEVSDQIHKVDVALERRYSGNSEKVLKICDTFEEVREVMMHLDQDFSKMRLYWKTLKGERDWKIYAAYGQYTRNILKVYDRIAELNMEISTLNRYIQRDIDYLVYRDQFMALFKRRNSDLEVLRNAYIIQPFEIFGKRLTGFNRVRKRMEDWYWDNRGKIIEVLGQTEWKRRRELVTKFKRAAQDWNDVRDEELYDLYNEVKRVSEQLRGLKRLEEGRERIETSLTESFFRHCEDTSFFDDQKPGDMAPTVLWAFMRMWPERYFEAGMIGLKEQMSVAQERRDKVTVHRVKGVLSKAERLAEERRHDQDKRLKLAGVYREPRYDLDKHVVEDKAAAERSNHAYFSYELYHANSERVQDEQEPLPGSPELRYHATNATHSDVLRGLGGKFVGFDLRWKPVARDEDGPKANTSLLMIATDSTIHLLHLARQRNVQPLITEEIKRVLESPDIFKVTVGSKEKCARLQKFLGVNPRGFIDLEDLHYDLQAKAGRTVSRSPLTLQDLMFEYLGYGLHPEAADMTVDLALRLRRTDQVAMGSNVYACFALWHTIYAEGQQKAEKAALLDRQRSAEQKALWERRRSIFSSFSEAPAPNSARRLPDGLSEEGADDADDFYTASKPTDSQTTSASPSLTDIWKSATETEMEKPGQDVMDAATSWVNSFLGSEEVSSSDGSSRRHQLLSYCLWYYGGFDVLAIAGNLSPEMANALPTDILEAIDRDGVPYDEKRVSELVEMLPEEVLWAEKYRRIARVVEFRRNGSSAQPSSMSHATRLRGIGHRGLEEYHEAEAWAVGFLRSRSSSDARANQSGPRHNSGVLRRLCLYRLWHSHRWDLQALGQVVFGGDFPEKKRRVPAERILSEISINRLPYDGAVEELLGALNKKSSDHVKNFVRVSNLTKESHAVMAAPGSQAETHDSMRAIVLEQRYDEAQKWARARLDEPCDKHRFYRYLHYRLWDHWNLSIDAIGTKYASERPSKLIALDIVGAIKYYGMPPGNEERMAELRRLLAEDAVLPEVSPSTDGGSGDPRRHWAAAEEWAQKWARRDSERGTMFRHYEYPRRLSMLTWYRLWQKYNYSVAALRKAVFPTDFAPALKEATIANQILVVLSTWPTMDYEAPRLKELMGLLPEEVVQTSFQELAKRTGFNISAGAQGAVPVPMKADRAPKQLRKARSSTMDAAALMRMSYVGNYEEPAKEQAGNKGIETSEGNINAARRTHLRRDKRSTKEETGNEKESRASARQASYPPTRFRRAGTLRSRRQ